MFFPGVFSGFSMWGVVLVFLQFHLDQVCFCGRARIVEGTETFVGIKGPAELNFELMAFELYLHSDSWA